MSLSSFCLEFTGYVLRSSVKNLSIPLLFYQNFDSKRTLSRLPAVYMSHIATILEWHGACYRRVDMDALTTAAASGLQARMDSLDMLANNLADTASSGFKVDREFYGSYLAPELANESNPIIGESPVIQRHWTDFSQGNLVSTGNSTDLALSGKGFFSVNGPNGPLYTRNGSFHLSSQGVLVTTEGYPVRLVGNQTLQTQSTDPIQVGRDGQITQNGAALGQLEIVNFNDPSHLNKFASTYFTTADPKTGPDAPSTAEVHQASVETSNAQPAEASARMISLLRNFEMLQRALKIGADMNRHAVEEVARVS
jgi:flagellar basal-body rod protein FlgF